LVNGRRGIEGVVTKSDLSRPQNTADPKVANVNGFSGNKCKFASLTPF